MEAESELMLKIVLCAVMASLVVNANAQNASRKTSQQNKPSPDVSTMPSEAEIGELVSKAAEYVETYRRTFDYAKPTLDKADLPGFNDEAKTLCDQANQAIATIRKNGSSGAALVTLITILDDMALNGARASAQSTLVALREDRADPKNHAMQDFQSLAQAEKNCYDISELLVHATLRYLSVEERVLGVLLEKQRK